MDILIFGTGGFYKTHKSELLRDFNVLYLVDNDKAKENLMIDDIAFIQPEQVINIDFSAIFIMSEFDVEIREQLLNLGVLPEKIIKGKALLKLSNGQRLNYIENKLFPADRILLACMQKSGSTYMATLFSCLPKFYQESFVPNYGGREQEICEYTINNLISQKNNIIAQQHVRYSIATERIIATFDLKVIVLVRDIFDVVLSTYDHCINESCIFPMAMVPSDFAHWEKDKAYEFIIDMIIPWYFNFYVSWVTCTIKEKIIYISYDDFMQNKRLKMTDMCRELKISVSEKEIDNAFEIMKTKQTRKNIGKSGRGKMLPDHLKEKIRRMTAYYDGIDFSLIGL